MRILGIIPARAGSKGVPCKNIRPLNGIPLVEYTFKAASSSNLLTKVMISTDDEKCIAFAKANSIDTPFIRPMYLATDNSSSLDVVRHALKHYQEKGEVFDAICLLQPTCPFRRSGFIDKAIKRFTSQDFDTLLSMLEVPHEYNPHWVFKVGVSGELQISTGDDHIIMRRQELPPAFHRDGSIYLVKTSTVLNHNTFYGKNMGYILSDPACHVNIDTPRDWDKAEQLAKNLTN